MLKRFICWWIGKHRWELLMKDSDAYHSTHKYDYECLRCGKIKETCYSWDFPGGQDA